MVSAFSIGTAKRGELSNNPQAKYVPGPGAYNPTKKQKIIPPSWKIGSSDRSKFVGNNTVGPGAYNQKNRIGEGAKYSIAQKNWIKSEQMKTPGPGAYNPKNKSDSKKYSAPLFSMGIKTGTSFITNKNGPGPGAYERKSTVMNRPSSKFGTGQRTALGHNEKVPGPGSYIQQRPSSAITKYSDSRYKDGPRFGFGTQVRDGMASSQKVPGPGSYNLKNSIELNKGVTMVSRRSGDDIYTRGIPGPGSYNPNKQQKIIPPSYKIGTGHRDELSRSQLVPGPGTYESHLYTRPKSPNCKIGTDVRRPLSGNNSTPGVGTYNFLAKSQGPKFSIKGNVTQDPIDRERQQMPGPGAYKPTVDSIKQRPQSAKIGSSMRPQLRNTGGVPGPGLYNIKNNRDGPKWAIGSGQRSGFQANKIPGVGTYNLKPYFADVPHYLMAQTTRQ